MLFVQKHRKQRPQVCQSSETYCLYRNTKNKGHRLFVKLHVLCTETESIGHRFVKLQYGKERRRTYPSYRCQVTAVARKKREDFYGANVDRGLSSYRHCGAENRENKGHRFVKLQVEYKQISHTQWLLPGRRYVTFYSCKLQRRNRANVHYRFV